MVRATTIGVLKNYRYGLNKSFTRQNDARTTVLTNRTFNSFAEDPSAAAQTFQLRRARMTAESQYTVCDTALRRFETAWSSLDTVFDRVNGGVNSVKNTDLTALNDPVGYARSALGKQLDILADTIVQVMNDKYAGDFLFSGADGKTVPFTWGEDGELLYRGIPVDASVPDTLTAEGSTDPFTIKLGADGKYDQNGADSYLVAGKSALVEYKDPPDIPENAIKNANGEAVIFKANGEACVTMQEVADEINAGRKCYFASADKGGTISQEDYDKEVKNVEKLNYLSEEEKLFLDIGLGNEEDANDKTITSSVFDSTLQGINFLGFGKDADGDPKNIVSLVKKMANICNADYEGPLNNEDYAELFRLVGKTEDASDEFSKQHVAMDARSTKLKNNLDLLEGNIDTLTEQYTVIEDVDAADAISAFLWATYSYNAALRVGNSVLSQSLMDYMQ